MTMGRKFKKIRVEKVQKKKTNVIEMNFKELEEKNTKEPEEKNTEEKKSKELEEKKNTEELVVKNTKELVEKNTKELEENNTEQLVEKNTKELEKKNTEEVIEVQTDYEHPLEYKWSLWVFINNKSLSWEENLVQITTFDTVEAFWRLYHYAKAPTELNLGQDYLIFKEGIRPAWEDPRNKNGGRWIINCDKKHLDVFWLHVILLIIGENLLHGDIISGAVVNVRTKYKISVWLSDASNERKVREIGKALKQNLPLLSRINFHRHNQTVNMFTI